MESAAFYEMCRQTWIERGVPARPPASDEEIVRTFAELGAPLSDDVRLLYSALDGFMDFTDDGMWSLWSLSRIGEESEGIRRPFVMFADYLISSVTYCFRYESPEVSSVCITDDGDELRPEPVAPSVRQFLEMLLSDPNTVEAWNLDETAADSHWQRFKTWFGSVLRGPQC